MSWQDGLFFIGSIALGLGLLPSIWSSDKPAVKTSLVTATVLASFCVAYVTLHLWAATIGTALDTLGWLVLLVQKVRA